MKTKRLIILLDGFLLVLGLCSRWISSLMLRLLPDCFVTQLGLQCPACGGTRCIRALASADYLTAFRYNWYFSITFLLAGIYLIFLNLGYVFQLSWCKRITERIPLPRLVILWAAGFVLFGILRNFM